MVTGAILFGVGVVLGAAIVLSTFVFHRWYEGYYRVTQDPELIYPQDNEPIADEVYFSQALQYGTDSEPDFSDEALEHYARHADIALGSELAEEDKDE